MNLLVKASKLTPEEGTITLRVIAEENIISVNVSDTGVGIRSEDLERIFQPFAPISRPTYVKSTGLGLSLTKGLVEAHGGRISSESSGKGK